MYRFIYIRDKSIESLPSSSIIAKFRHFEEKTTFVRVFWMNEIPYVNLRKKDLEEHFGKNLDKLKLRKDYLTIRELMEYCDYGKLKLDDEIFCVVALRDAPNLQVKAK